MLSISAINKRIKSSSYFYWFLREQYVVVRSLIYRIFDRPAKNKKKRILFYHINSLGHAGTEKYVQILAKHIDKRKYDVFFLYPNNTEEHQDYSKRLDYIRSGGVIAVPFDYSEIYKNPPYFVSGMNPDIKKIINTLNIDLLVTPGAGNANYPFSIIKSVPIILLNIFGQPNLQKNIKFHLCISREVADKLLPVVPENKIRVFPVPSDGPTEQSRELGKKIRSRFNIRDDDFVFGRIGRDDNNIFDPIGIEAFNMVQKEYSNVHYVIMSPPLVLVEIVEKEKIKNVHFLKPSSDENDIWAFHQSIDAMAHFRNDGESFGLNIVESMLCGKPIISHRSHIWNAQMEYLDPSFSRVTERSDVNAYYLYMKELILLKKANKLTVLGQKAKEKGARFLITNLIDDFENIIESATNASNIE